MRYVPIRPRYECICTQKYTARQWWAPSETDLERPQWWRACCVCAATAGWWGNSLMELRARVRSVKETKNTSQWLPEPKSTIRQWWGRTPKCDLQKNPIELKIEPIMSLETLWPAPLRGTGGLGSKICHRRSSRVLRAQARADGIVCRVDHGALRVAHRTMVQLYLIRPLVRVLRTDESSQSRVSGIASSTTRPSRACRSAKHPARSASTSTSTRPRLAF